MNVVYSRAFEKELRKNSRKLREKVYERQRLWIANPRNPLLDDHGLNPPYSGCRSFNVSGDLRVIYRNESDGAALFLRFGTHHELYGT